VSSSSKIVLFELNEVPWRVIDDHVEAHPESPLARILPRAARYETIAEDTSLSPWITWPTLHRGVADEEHTITDFGQDLGEINAAYPSVWEILARHGVRTGVCGSLHSYPLPSNAHDYAFYVPDVFAAGSECFPRSIEAFQDFNLSMSRESARNVSTSLPVRKALRFVARAPGLGLTPKTALDVAGQLVDERLHPFRKVRRRTYQVVLAFDVFMKELARTRPSFATFFTNHVASSMHRYWAARYPGDYDVYEFDGAWAKTYKDEIAWTMGRVDRMLARVLAFVEASPDYELWIASSMGQAATEAHQILTQVYLQDVPRFMRALGFEGGEWESRPAMAPRVILSLREPSASRFEAALRGITIADRGPLPWKRLANGVFRIHPGILQNVKDETCTVRGDPVPFEKLGFANVTIQDSVGQSAYHVPSGSLIRYAPGRAVDRARPQVSTRDVAPSLLRAFGITPPPHMRGASFA